MKSRISRNISIVLRAERMITRRQMTILRNQTGMIALAALVATIGLVMLNIAGFFYLDQTMTPQGAALTVALVDMVLAVLVAVFAGRQNAKAELEPVTEVRDMAIEDLEAELQGTLGELREAGDNLRRIVRDPLGSALPAVVGPILTAALRKATRK